MSDMNVHTMGEMFISHFGQCKQLKLDRMSNSPSTQAPPDTVSWHAPEVLPGEAKLNGDGAAGGSAAGPSSTWSPTWQTQSVDIRRAKDASASVYMCANRAHGGSSEGVREAKRTNCSEQ